MDALEMAKKRHSVRRYMETPIEPEKADLIRKELERLNAESGLSMQYIEDGSKVFSAISMKMLGWGKYVPAYIAVCGTDDYDLEEKCGYYGEQFVLYAQSLGLNTCWVGMFKKKYAAPVLKDGERMVITISVGYGENNGKPHKSKFVEDVSDVEDMPDWFRSGVECALLAPTAINQQKFIFYMEGDEVLAKIDGKGPFIALDLGIAKYHFEIGSGRKVQ